VSLVLLVSLVSLVSLLVLVLVVDALQVAMSAQVEVALAARAALAGLWLAARLAWALLACLASEVFEPCFALDSLALLETSLALVAPVLALLLEPELPLKVPKPQPRWKSLPPASVRLAQQKLPGVALPALPMASCADRPLHSAAF